MHKLLPLDGLFNYQKLVYQGVAVDIYVIPFTDPLVGLFIDQSQVHVLPREMLGKSTFGLSMSLLKWLPMRTVDNFLLLVSRIMLGDTARLGLERPQLGPLELKSISGKTPVLDVGTLATIKSGDTKVRSYCELLF